MNKAEKQRQELERKLKEVRESNDAVASAAASVELQAVGATQQKKAKEEDTSKTRTDENDFYFKPTIQAKPLMIGGFRFRI